MLVGPSKIVRGKWHTASFETKPVRCARLYPTQPKKQPRSRFVNLTFTISDSCQLTICYPVAVLFSFQADTQNRLPLEWNPKHLFQRQEVCDQTHWQKGASKLIPSAWALWVGRVRLGLLVNMETLKLGPWSGSCRLLFVADLFGASWHVSVRGCVCEGGEGGLCIACQCQHL